MKIVVIGGSGLIGSKTVERLRKKGHDVVSASPNTGVNTVTGEGLDEALAGAEIVIDLSNSPSFEEAAAVEFFEASGRNLLKAEKAAGVGHHVALSVVGAERLQSSGYFRAKMAQENLIRESGVPYTIVHSTQFFEFTNAIAQTGTLAGVAHVPTAYFQPISADDVADAVTTVALEAPVNGVVEIAGPERTRMSDLVAHYLKAVHDPREVVGDSRALYYGYEIDDGTLVPGDKARIGATRFDDWLKQAAARRAAAEPRKAGGASA
ncbi:MAG TPA: SDR family oxidoreductase [Rhizomicrobium sp.]|nr:SDR family oxidoreductase [Rhizomicrobium sp.]